MTFKELLRVLSPITLRPVPYWRRSWKHRGARYLLGVFYCYLGVILVLLCLENRLLFPASPAAASWAAPPTDVSVEDVALTAVDGTPLHAWWSAPAGWMPSDGAVLFCHGNGGNLSHRGGCIGDLHKYLKTAVMLIDYPGYGRCEGSPNEKGCYAAGDAGYDWLTDVRGIAGDRIILYGGSLGGGIATDLAVRRPHRALVLVSTFTSIPDQVQCLYPWLPARWLVRAQFNNLAKIASVSGPIFVAHGRQDDLIPFSMGERLVAAAPLRKQFFPMDNWGHSDGLSAAAYSALRAFLEASDSRAQR